MKTENSIIRGEEIYKNPLEMDDSSLENRGKLYGFSMFVFSMVIGLILGLLLNLFVIERVSVIGSSMEPTYHEGNSMLCLKQCSIDREDVIVADVDDNGRELRVIKRVVGTPGDTVDIHNGRVYIDSREYRERHSQGVTYAGDYNNIILGDNEYFVLGDNRENSNDSRYFGVVDREDIVGKIVVDLF